MFAHIRNGLKTIRRTTCCRTVPSRASGTPCGSSYGRFCILIKKDIETGFRICPNRFWLEPVFNQTGFLNVLAETGSVTGFRFGSRPSCYTKTRVDFVCKFQFFVPEQCEPSISQPFLAVMHIAKAGENTCTDFLICWK